MGAECRAGERAATRYRPRRPSRSVLYRWRAIEFLVDISGDDDP